MLFQNDEASLRLEVVNYEFPADGGAADSDDRNWLVLRCTWIDEEGSVRKDSNSCLLTYELRELAAGLKGLRAGIREEYHSDFLEPYFQLDARAEENDFQIRVLFVLPNTMDGDDTAEIECTMTEGQLQTLIEELDRLSERYPDRS